ncbi:MAG: hypothetical protein ACE366_09525 [Bradymonadia bacterium]
MNAPPAPPRQTRWLVSPRYDGLFFIGGALVTLLFLGLYHLADAYEVGPRGDAIILTYFVYTAIFDHPHIFQTFSRTHLDKESFARHRLAHTWGLGGFIVAGFVLGAMGLEGELIIFAAFYGTWHIIRQHWGFIKIYKGLNADFRPVDDHLDGAFFYLGMLALTVHDYVDEEAPSTVYGTLKVQFPSVPSSVADGLMLLFGVATCLFVARQIWRLWRGVGVNWPKLALMGAAIGTHGVVFWLTATPFLVAEALETAYHNVQYQGFVMHWQRRRFPRQAMAVRWGSLALVYGIVVGVIEVTALMNRSWSLVFTPFAMIVLWHYYIDGKIWRTREDPRLKSLLTSSPTR